MAPNVNVTRVGPQSSASGGSGDRLQLLLRSNVRKQEPKEPVTRAQSGDAVSSNRTRDVEMRFAMMRERNLCRFSRGGLPISPLGLR